MLKYVGIAGKAPGLEGVAVHADGYGRLVGAAAGVATNVPGVKPGKEGSLVGGLKTLCFQGGDYSVCPGGHIGDKPSVGDLAAGPVFGLLGGWGVIRMVMHIVKPVFDDVSSPTRSPVSPSGLALSDALSQVAVGFG